jgi:hypothetical protein
MDNFMVCNHLCNNTESDEGRHSNFDEISFVLIIRRRIWRHDFLFESNKEPNVCDKCKKRSR